MKFADCRRTEFLTKLGMPVMVRIPIVCTDSILRQSEGEVNGAQEAPAYVRIGVTYSLSRLSLVFIGMGLFLLSSGYSIPRTRVAFLVMSEVCAPNVSCRSNVTPRYFTRFDQLIVLLSSRRGSTLVMYLCPKMMLTVLLVLILMRHR